MIKVQKKTSKLRCRPMTTREQLKEIHLQDLRHIQNFLEQKQGYPRTGLKIFYCRIYSVDCF